MFRYSAITRLTLSAIGLGLYFLGASAEAQTTAFTYQGKLTDTGTPASGNYDFEFRLFDSDTGGTQIGTTQTLTINGIANGIFTAQLDFGVCPTCFDGGRRFLDIRVRPTGGGAFTALTPRQEVTSNPYAIKSLKAATADGLSVACVSCVTSSQIQSVSGASVTGAIPVASMPAGNINYIQNTTSPQPSSNFNINGTGVVGGSLGVGTPSPGSKLEVIDAANTGLRVQNNTAGGTIASFGGTGAFNIDANAQPGGRFTVLENGFVGIGTNPPTSKLHVTGGDITRVHVNAFSNAGLRLGLNSQSKWSLATVTPGNFQIFNEATAQNAVWINTSDNNVGIGTTNPTSKVHLSGTGITRVHVNSDSNAGLRLGLSDQSKWSLATVTGGDFQIFNDATGQNAVWINSSNNNVGIGTSGPSFKLHVSDPANTGLRVETQTSGGSVASFGGFGNFQIDSPGFPGGRFKVLEDGRVGINMIVGDPQDQLHVIGDIRVSNCVKSQFGPIAGICLSDERLKRNIEPFEPALGKLAQVRPVHFDWRSDEYPYLNFSSARSYGLIAQQVEKVLPEMVTQDERGFKAVNYSQLPLFLLQAIRELKAENDGLREELRIQNQQLRTELREIRERLGMEVDHLQ